jgi:hypothetical protein
MPLEREGRHEGRPGGERDEEGESQGGKSLGREGTGEGQGGIWGGRDSEREWGRGGMQAPLRTRTVCMGETGGSGRG